MPLMFRNVSCCPANDASGRSSAVALERTAHETDSGCGSRSTSAAYAARMSASSCAGSGWCSIHSRTFAPDAGELGDVRDIERFDGTP